MKSASKSQSSAPRSTKPTAIAILGGTFDPIHIGHLRVAVRLRDSGFDKVLLVPNRVPPHRAQPQASGDDRLNMLQLSLTGLNGIEASDIELTQDGTSYSARTVEQLRTQYPDAALTWVMGNDAWNGFDRWHKPEQVLANANILVISRPGEEARDDAWLGQLRQEKSCTLNELQHSPHGRVCHQAWPELDISASDLRQAIKQGDNIAFLTPQPVLEYIQKHHLYS